MGKLDGKVALVSGSGRGIGRAIALKLAGEGANIVVNDLDEAPALETIAAIEKSGGRAVACPGDVTAADFGERFVGAALDAFEGLDIIVNNAGYTWDSVIQKMTDEQFQAILDVHLTAPFRILRAAAEFIRASAKREIEDGRAVYRKVVNISSISGLYGNAGQINYAAAKSALIGLTKTMAREWGRYNVNVNCLAFGFIATRLTEAIGEAGGTIEIAGRDLPVGIRPEAIEAMVRTIPLGRPGTAEEAADAVYLFCTPESNYISGQIVVVAGGL
jgi:3-oxoacyl-[acyl-carrier protein] reductase